MASIVWCDRIEHVVRESRTEVADGITAVSGGKTYPPNFLYLTPVKTGRQRAFNVDLISTYEAKGTDPI